MSKAKNEVKLELKKKDLASYLGITPKTFSRKLKELVKRWQKLKFMVAGLMMKR